MKIIKKDNFDRDYKSEYLIAENVQAYYAKFIADALNDKYGGDDSEDFFKAEDDDYKLYKWEP